MTGWRNASRRERFTLVATLIWMAATLAVALPLLCLYGITPYSAEGCPPPPGPTELRIETCRLFSKINAFVGSLTSEQVFWLFVFSAIWTIIYTVIIEPYWNQKPGSPSLPG